jgi:hypothetical protein
MEIRMNKLIGLFAAAATLLLAGGANAHSLQLGCHKTAADTVVCRTVASDGEVLRGVTVQIVDEANKVMSTGKTDAQGQYTFKAPAGEYNVVVEADKSHVGSVSGEDIW